MWNNYSVDATLSDTFGKQLNVYVLGHALVRLQTTYGYQSKIAKKLTETCKTFEIRTGTREFDVKG